MLGLMRLKEKNWEGEELYSWVNTAVLGARTEQYLVTQPTDGVLKGCFTESRGPSASKAVAPHS